MLKKYLKTRKNNLASLTWIEKKNPHWYYCIIKELKMLINKY